MNVRLLFGPKVGEVQYIQPAVALELLRQGRAEDPRLDGMREKSAGISKFEQFADGGEVSDSSVFVVGDFSPSGSVLPRPVAQKLEAIAAAKGKGRSKQ
jgi:hypothetical protein